MKNAMEEADVGGRVDMGGEQVNEEAQGRLGGASGALLRRILGR